MIFLVIKGSYGEAWAKAGQLGISLTEARSPDGRETQATCENWYSDAVKSWYLADAGLLPPFPPGSLLHYSMRGQ